MSLNIPAFAPGQAMPVRERPAFILALNPAQRLYADSVETNLRNGTLVLREDQKQAYWSAFGQTLRLTIDQVNEFLRWINPAEFQAEYATFADFDPLMQQLAENQRLAVVAFVSTLMNPDFKILPVSSKTLVYTRASDESGLPLSTINSLAKIYDRNAFVAPIFEMANNKPPSMALPASSSTMPTATSQLANQVAEIDKRFENVPVLSDDEWAIKVGTLLNDPTKFDKLNDIMKKTFLVGALKMAGLKPEQWQEFNLRLGKLWKPAADRMRPFLLIRFDADNVVTAYSLVSDRGSLSLDFDQLEQRAVNRKPLLISDYRIVYLGIIRANNGLLNQRDLDPLGFYYRAAEALEKLVSEDQEMTEIFSMGISLQNPDGVYGEWLNNSLQLPARSVHNLVRMLNDHKSVINRFFRRYDAMVADTNHETITNVTEPINLFNMFYSNEAINNTLEVVSQLYDGFPYGIAYPIIPEGNTVRVFRIVGSIPLSTFIDWLITAERRADNESPLLEDLETLQDELIRSTRQFSDNAIALQGAFDRARDDVIQLYEARLMLGKRRCLNRLDPGDPTIEIETIPERNYIRLSNGMCWDIVSLIYWIRNQSHGVNDSVNLMEYPSPRIWENQADLDRIIAHPIAQEDKFGPWITSILLGNVAKQVSNNTMEAMKRAIQIYVSRGPFFEAFAKSQMEPRLYDFFLEKYGLDIFKLQKLGNQGLTKEEVGLKNEIYLFVREIMKSKMSESFSRYYDAISQAERDALQTVNPDFHQDTTLCVRPGNGKESLCVFIYARTLKSTYNALAEMKGLPKFEVNTAED